MGEQANLPVTFLAADEVTLRGETIGEGAPAIVLVHESGRDLDGWGATLERLAGHGFGVLAFDLRGHGASDGDVSQAHVTMDVQAAILAASPDGGAVVVVSAGDTAAGATAAAVHANAAGLVLISPSYRCTTPALP